MSNYILRLEGTGVFGFNVLVALFDLWAGFPMMAATCVACAFAIHHRLCHLERTAP